MTLVDELDFDDSAHVPEPRADLGKEMVPRAEGGQYLLGSRIAGLLFEFVDAVDAADGADVAS